MHAMSKISIDRSANANVKNIHLATTFSWQPAVAMNNAWIDDANRNSYYTLFNVSDTIIPRLYGNDTNVSMATIFCAICWLYLFT